MGRMASQLWLTIPRIIALFSGYVRQSDKLLDVQDEQTKSVRQDSVFCLEASILKL